MLGIPVQGWAGGPIAFSTKGRKGEWGTQGGVGRGTCGAVLGWRCPMIQAQDRAGHCSWASAGEGQEVGSLMVAAEPSCGLALGSPGQVPELSVPSYLCHCTLGACVHV